jgi:hypothetical protein
MIKRWRLKARLRGHGRSTIRRLARSHIAKNWLSSTYRSSADEPWGGYAFNPTGRMVATYVGLSMVPGVDVAKREVIVG